MSLVKFTVLIGIVVSLAVSHRASAAFEWQTDAPQGQGMSAERVRELQESLAKHGTTDLLIVRHDRIVCEWYAEGWSADKPHGTASLAKAMIGGMSTAVAMQDGRVKPEEAAAKFVPSWRGDPVKSKITVGQLATHTSGLDDAEQGRTAHDKLTGWKGEFWKREPTDPFTIARDQTPVVHPPGERVSYSNPGMAMLSYCVTAAIQGGEQKDVRSLLRERVFKPIGIGDKEWSVGYGKTYAADGLNLVANWGGAAFTPRAAARVGRLMLRGGDWGGRRILDESVVRTCVDPPNTSGANAWEGENSPRPGFGWWTNRDGAWPSVPRDAFVGSGAGNQMLVVIPSLDLVCVRNGTSLAADEPNWQAEWRYVLRPLCEAIVDPPYPSSDVIRAVRFDPVDKIIRKAIDSDNWPMTWGDDGHLYTAYGDGRGFEPFIEPKLSLGIARIEGGPPDVRGFNLRAPTIERTGGGEKGAKASGMLMVGGTLYMWVRNTGNATLAWSADHGATWQWGFRFDESFGCPAFLNFGKDYAGAPDEYVYTYSQDGPSAYAPYDAVVLARVPRSKVTERAAYEFFSGTDAQGAVKWSADIKARKAVFAYQGHCERLDVVYHPVLKRFLMALSFGHGKGWGIFDAPSPWGPWTTAFQTADWGLGETHGYRLPSKWFADDGKTAWLVFSGRKFEGVEYDAFCLRRMTMDLYPP